MNVRHFLRAAHRDLGPIAFWTQLLGGAAVSIAFGLALLGFALVTP